MKKEIEQNRGITLVALIITIVVMLILVAVSVNVVVKSNLIGTAEKAVEKYNKVAEEEGNSGVIEIDGKKYNSIEDYLAGKVATDQADEGVTKKLEVALHDALNGRETFNINELKAEIEKYGGTVKGIKPAQKIPVSYQFPVTVTLDNIKFAVENNRKLLEDRRN